MPDLDRREFLTRAAGSAAACALTPLLEPWTPAPGTEPVALALVGVGRQGRAILGELAKLPAARVVALCDRNENRLRAGQRRIQDAEGFGDLGALLQRRPDVQAVVVATPTHLHKPAALEALAAGKHVYCEAPLASTVGDCRELVRAARGAATVFHAGLVARTNPVYQLALSFVRSGALDRVVAVQASWNEKTSWRFAGGDAAAEAELNWRLDPALSTGLAGEVGSHQFDVASWFLDRLPAAVRGRGAVRLWEDGREVADSVEIEVLYPGGVALRYQASLCSSYEGHFELFRGSWSSIRLAETHGWMFKEADAPTQGWEVYALKQRFHQDEGITLIADATKLAELGKLKEGVGLPNPALYYSLEGFLRSVVEGRPAAVSADEGLRAAVVGIRAHEAVARGEELPIPEDLYRLD